MNEITRTFTKNRDTKNKVVFDEVEEDGQELAVGTLYVSKGVAQDTEKVTVTICPES